MIDKLEVVARDPAGSRGSRRLRRDGLVPVVLYGHSTHDSLSRGSLTQGHGGGEGQCVHLATKREALEAVIRHGSRIVELSGAVQESAMVRELQWDSRGSHPLHVDLLRVSKSDRVRVKVPVDLKGESPGQRAGGVVNLVLHEIELECTADAIPERVHAQIGGLEVGHTVKVHDLELPPGARAVAGADDTVVTCTMPGRGKAVEETAASAEPEVIGARKEATEEATAGESEA
jgi:large subunit ribosomal protein L25